jgi:hypothetical protein
MATMPATQQATATAPLQLELSSSRSAIVRANHLAVQVLTTNATAQLLL